MAILLTAFARCAVGGRARSALLGSSLAAVIAGAPCAADTPSRPNGDWTMPALNYASTRFSELVDINAGNVKNLAVQFTFSIGVNRGQEGAPLVVNNTMYIVAPYPNELFALDLTKPGAPLKWSYKPAPQAAAQGVACCDVVNRGGVLLRRCDLLRDPGRQCRRH